MSQRYRISDSTAVGRVGLLPRVLFDRAAPSAEGALSRPATLQASTILRMNPADLTGPTTAMAAAEAQAEGASARWGRQTRLFCWTGLGRKSCRTLYRRRGEVNSDGQAVVSRHPHLHSHRPSRDRSRDHTLAHRPHPGIQTRSRWPAGEDVRLPSGRGDPRNRRRVDRPRLHR